MRALRACVCASPRIRTMIPRDDKRGNKQMCACMYVFEHVCVFIRTHRHTHIHLSAAHAHRTCFEPALCCLHTHTDTNTYAYTCPHMHEQMYFPLSACMRMHTREHYCMCACMHRNRSRRILHATSKPVALSPSIVAVLWSSSSDLCSQRTPSPACTWAGQHA